LQELISPTRWLGIMMIAIGVGFAATGPSVTPLRSPSTAAEPVDAVSLKGNS